MTNPAAVPASAVHVLDLTKTFLIGPGQTLTAINAVTLSVDPGNVVALIGPSGSGKSTLLHLIGAIEKPDSGAVEVDGVDICRLSHRRLASYRRSVGFVFQRYNLLPALTATDNVLAPVLPYRTSFDKRARAGELLGAVGLAGREKALPSRLSGGQQQRVATARALINTPALLLADEPTGNLDSHTGEDILDLLLGLRAQRGMAIIIATHDPLVAARCDRIVRLRDGTLVDGTHLSQSESPETTMLRIEGLS